jgi:hypothetical protein
MGKESQSKIEIYDTRTGEHGKPFDWITDEVQLRKRLECVMECENIHIFPAVIKDIDPDCVTYDKASSTWTL